MEWNSEQKVDFHVNTNELWLFMLEPEGWGANKCLATKLDRLLSNYYH